MSIAIEVDWTKYTNFFDLWRTHRHSTKLLYVIGDQHHSYIGSIGSRDGAQGLGTRYQWQYVHRACAIFGLDESAGQLAYAGVFRNDNAVTGRSILAAEADVQNKCVVALGPEGILFDPETSMKNSGSPISDRFRGSSKMVGANKPLVPTRKSEALLLAAQRRR